MACRGNTAPVHAQRRATTLESLVRASLVAWAVGMVGSVIVSEYVGAGVFAIVTPALVGVACGEAATRASGAPPRSRAQTLARVAAVLYALIGTAYAFRFVPGGGDPFGPAGHVLPPYVAAAAAAWLWTIPPRRAAQRGRSASET